MVAQNNEFSSMGARDSHGKCPDTCVGFKASRFILCLQGELDGLYCLYHPNSSATSSPILALVPVPSSGTGNAATAPTSGEVQVQLSFWTSCAKCKLELEYLLEYRDKKVICPNCHVPFLAKDKQLNVNKGGSSEVVRNNRINSESTMYKELVAEKNGHAIPVTGSYIGRPVGSASFPSTERVKQVAKRGKRKEQIETSQADRNKRNLEHGSNIEVPVRNVAPPIIQTFKQVAKRGKRKEQTETSQRNLEDGSNIEVPVRDVAPPGIETFKQVEKRGKRQHQIETRQVYHGASSSQKLSGYPEEASPEDIFAALTEIPNLARDDLLTAYSSLTQNNRMFRSLMALPLDMRRDWLLIENHNKMARMKSIMYQKDMF